MNMSESGDFDRNPEQQEQENYKSESNNNAENNNNTMNNNNNNNDDNNNDDNDNYNTTSSPDSPSRPNQQTNNPLESTISSIYLRSSSSDPLSSSSANFLHPKPDGSTLKDEHLESLLNKLRIRQIQTSQRRTNNLKELESMKNQLKKVKRETEELLKAQQSNLSTMGRKL